jgi:hypothetical protein
MNVYFRIRFPMNAVNAIYTIASAFLSLRKTAAVVTMALAPATQPVEVHLTVVSLVEQALHLDPHPW